MCLLFSPSASIDSDHILELYSQGLEVGFVSLKKDCLNFRNRSPKKKKKRKKQPLGLKFMRVPWFVFH